MGALLKMAGEFLKKALKKFLKQKARETAEDMGIVKIVIISVASLIIAVPLMLFVLFGELLWPQPSSPPSGTAISITDGIWALSSKYEGGGDPGVCSTGAGDAGGMSCGAFQLASVPGTLASFISFLGTNYPNFYAMLENVPLTYNPFAQDWRSVYNSDNQGFFNAQAQYIAATHYTPIVQGIKDKYGFDATTRSKAVQEMFWSYAVQHRYNTIKAWGAVIGSNWQNMSDEEIITKMYDYRIASWTCCTRRFVSEKADALALLAAEESAKQTVRVDQTLQ